MLARHAILILSGAIILGALIIVELPKYQAHWEASRSAELESKAEAGVWDQYKHDTSMRLTAARLACQEATKTLLNDPAPVFTDIEDWPTKESPPEHFTVDLRVRAKSTFAGYRLLSAHCTTEHDVHNDGWSNNVSIAEP